MVSENTEDSAPANIEQFLPDAGLTHESLLDIVRASMRRPTVLFERALSDIRTNTFNSWIANGLKSNMDLQFILEAYSSAPHVVEYIDRTNRGMSNL